MPVKLDKVLYTAEAVVEGGREGHGRTSDGRLDVTSRHPGPWAERAETARIPNGSSRWASQRAFSRRLLGVARGRGTDATDSRIASSVSIGPTGEGGFTLQVSLDLHAPGISREEATELMERAHQRCPYSNATRGNTEVTLMVDGEPLEAAVDPDRAQPA